MSIAARVKRFLNQNKVCYQILNYERQHSIAEIVQKFQIPTHQVLKAVPITDGVNILLAIMPWNFEIDFACLELELHSVYHSISKEEVASLFCDCEKGVIPPFGEIYHLHVILDKSLETLDTVYLETGSSSALLEMSFEDFRFLNGSAPLFSFAYLEPCQEIQKHSSAIIKSKWQDIAETFPTLPLQASKILELAETLVFQQKMPAMNKDSHFFKFSEFDHMALAQATHQVFKLPKEAFLGSKTFWKHALYSANLAQRLSTILLHNEKQDVLEHWDPSLCYLLGFTHNFGFLLFGHLFFHEYRLLSKWMEQNPKAPIELLERKLLGMGRGAHLVGRGHAELGAWLMHYWNMPEIFVIVAEHHHDLVYEGSYADYIALIQLTNQLLNQVGIGKESSSVPIEQNLKHLNITRTLAESILMELLEDPKARTWDEVALGLAS